MNDVIVRSLISVQPLLRNNYRSVLPPDNDGFSCFEVLGCVLESEIVLSPNTLSTQGCGKR